MAAAIDLRSPGPIVSPAQASPAGLGRGQAGVGQARAHESAASSLACRPPKDPLDMASTTAPLRSSFASAATMASGDSIQRAGVPDLPISSAMRLASTRSLSGTLAMAVGGLMLASAAPLLAGAALP